MARQDPLLAETLRAVPIFGHIPDESEACFAALRRGKVRDFGDGDLVLARSDGEHAIFLLKGSVRSGDNGAAVSAPGAYFGVFELIANRRIERDVVALGPVRAFALQEAALHDLLATCPSLVAHLLTDCARRLLAKEICHD